MTSAIALMLGFGLVLARRVLADVMSEVAPLAAVSLLFGFAFACFEHGNREGSSVWLLAGNLLIFACAVMFHMTLCTLFEQPVRMRFTLLVAAASWLGGLWYTLGSPSLAGRAVLFGTGLLVILLTTLAGLLLHWRQRRSSGSGLMLLILGVLVLTLAARTLLGALHWLDYGIWLWRAPLEAMLFIVIASSFVSLMLIAVALLSRRALGRLRASSASEDILTGLANRSSMLDFLDEQLERCAQKESSLSLLLVEIDNFRQFCDWYGSALGERVLVHVAQSLQARVRRGDRVGRWGEASFLVVLPGSGEKFAHRCAAGLLSRMRRHGFEVDSLALDLAVCSGIATTQACETGREALIPEVERSLRVARARPNGMGPVALLD